MFKSAKDKSMLFCADEGGTVSLPASDYKALVNTAREGQKEIKRLKSECKVKDAKIEELERECESKDLMDPDLKWTDGMPKHQYIWYMGKRIRCELEYTEASKYYDRLIHVFRFREC